MCINASLEKKAKDLVILNVNEISAFADYFIICTGTSDRMIDALANASLDDIRKKHRKKGKKEGNSRDGWVVVDYGDVVVHLFSPDQRDFYQLEELWEGGKVLLRLQ